MSARKSARFSLHCFTRVCDCTIRKSRGLYPRDGRSEKIDSTRRQSQNAKPELFSGTTVRNTDFRPTHRKSVKRPTAVSHIRRDSSTYAEVSTASLLASSNRRTSHRQRVSSSVSVPPATTQTQLQTRKQYQQKPLSRQHSIGSGTSSKNDDSCRVASQST